MRFHLNFYVKLTFHINHRETRGRNFLKEFNRKGVAGNIAMIWGRKQTVYAINLCGSDHGHDLLWTVEF